MAFPSPAELFSERNLSLDELCQTKPASTFFMRVEGSALESHGIFSGDILVVDKSVNPKHGHIVVAMVEDEFMVRQLHARNGIFSLVADPGHKPIIFNDWLQIPIFGVVCHSVRNLYQ